MVKKEAPVAKVDAVQLIATLRIPPIPEALRRVLEAATQPTTTSAQLEQLVVQDAGLCAQILKLVNSSYYALAARVTSINQAIVLLGFPTVKSLASSLIMLHTVGNLEGIDKNYLQRVWKRSVACGPLVRMLSIREDKAIQQRLFLAGLVHDIGHLVLSVHFKQKYELLRDLTNFPSPEDEVKKLGTDHPQVGAALLKQWGFGTEVVELVRLHHSMTDAPQQQKEIIMLELGDLLADLPHKGKSFADLVEHPEMMYVQELTSQIGRKWEDVLAEENKIFSREEENKK